MVRGPPLQMRTKWTGLAPATHWRRSVQIGRITIFRAAGFPVLDFSINYIERKWHFPLSPRFNFRRENEGTSNLVRAPIYLIFMSFLLGGCYNSSAPQSSNPVSNTSATEETALAYQNALDAAMKSTTLCGKQLDSAKDLQGAMLTYVKCTDAALLKMAAITDSDNIDIYQEQAAQTEVAAAQYDAGAITLAEFEAMRDEYSAEANKSLKDRELARDPLPSFGE